MTPSNRLESALSLAARALIALLFVPSGWAKIGGFAGTVGYIAAKGVPLPQLCAALAIAAELVLPLLLLIGWRTRPVALALAVYTIVITPIFHAYWDAPAAQHMMQYLNFYKNLAIAGGLLSIAATGARAWGLDARGARMDAARA